MLEAKLKELGGQYESSSEKWAPHAVRDGNLVTGGSVKGLSRWEGQQDVTTQSEVCRPWEHAPLHDGGRVLSQPAPFAVSRVWPSSRSA